MRAIFLVTLALLPLGAVALWQTHQIIQEQRAAADRALLALTERAVMRERQVIERTIGAAAALGASATSFQSDLQGCRNLMQRFQSASTLYSFVGYRPANSAFDCTSTDFVGETLPDEELNKLIEQQTVGLYTTDTDGAIAVDALVVATPVFAKGVYAGHMRLHIPRSRYSSAAQQPSATRPLGVIVFNQSDDIIVFDGEGEVDYASKVLPNDLNLVALNRSAPTTFTATTQSGSVFTYAWVPLVGGSAYALAVWDQSANILKIDGSYWRTIGLAVLMWLASILVVYLIMHALVVRGVQRLNAQIRRFSAERLIPAGSIQGRGELYDLETEFRRMAGTILRDEADLENAVHEKKVLLKEVHHRVRNSLQLINSIINMILRGSPSDETRQAVRRLQDRVMAMASAYRTIYQADALDKVDVSEIIKDIVDQRLIEARTEGQEIQIETSMAELSLFPDQAMPLSLLASEAVATALEQSKDPSQPVVLSIKTCPEKSSNSDQTATLRISYRLDPDQEPSEFDALEMQLMQAFSRQLGGDFQQTTEKGYQVISVKFPILTSFH